ncbi:MAG: hypothetical protein DCO81_03980 [Candidatus Aquiluna sp. XM-24bin5]|nr:MAG: hypothetical protein DCO81_03980 [Candidatus Aquiluna sp. XM-24bin5]
MKSLLSIALAAALVAVPLSAASTETERPETTQVRTAPVIVKSLTDYPGRVREVTETQKAEIRAVLERLDGNTKFICTGARVADNPYRMNLAVRMRAKLVCEYAKSLRPDLSYWYQTKVTKHQSFNSRVIVVSK